jgi:hypothetical protein
MERAKVRPAELARAIGVTPSAITYLKAVTETHSCGEGSIRIADYFGVSTMWLCLGEGEPPADVAPAKPRDVRTATPPTRGLTLLQAATLEQLDKAMRAGQVSEEACLDLMNAVRKN